MNARIRIATRGSRLALWQARWVATELERRHPGLAVELVEIRSAGDRDRTTPLAAMGGAGLFTKAIQDAVLDGRADLAVHSLKDLPTAATGGLVIAAIPVRESAFDGLIAPRLGTLAALPAGARVGTGSPRRRALLLHARPDLEVVDVRGNVETRLAYATEARLDAVVLAVAGLKRLDLAAHVTERLSPPVFLPAVGQGALAVECRESDTAIRAALAPLDDAATRAAVTAERALLSALQGGCSVPLAALGLWSNDGVRLAAAVVSRDGRERIDAAGGPARDAVALGQQVAQELRDRGAAALLG